MIDTLHMDISTCKESELNPKLNWKKNSSSYPFSENPDFEFNDSMYVKLGEEPGDPVYFFKYSGIASLGILCLNLSLPKFFNKVKMSAAFYFFIGQLNQ